MPTKKILMFVGDSAEDDETMDPLQALGDTVCAVCQDKKTGETIRTAAHDFENTPAYTEKPGHNFVLNATFDDMHVENQAHVDGNRVAAPAWPAHPQWSAKVLDVLGTRIDL